jgi:hypothetical protein
LVGEVVEMEGLGVGYVGGDFGAGNLPVGAEAAEFIGFESYGDLLSFGGGDGDGGLGGAVVVDIDAEEEAGGLGSEIRCGRGRWL